MRGAIVCGVVLVCSCAGQPAARTCGDFAWLVGTWRTADGSNEETWTALGRGSLTGKNVTVDAGEVVAEEGLVIEFGGDQAVYRASPPTQPTHEFPMTECGEGWATFADPAHDFPQTITYRRSHTTLTATVGGGGRTQTWSWRLAGE